jgi:hypothetical protein
MNETMFNNAAVGGASLRRELRTRCRCEAIPRQMLFSV